MKVYRTNQVILYDVDDTLVMWHYEDQSIQIPITDPYLKGVVNYVTPNVKHIDLLKKHKARGFTVIVWSAQGFEWAEAVVQALNLEEFVDIVCSKPSGYVDDLEVTHWIGSRIYLK
jgi:hypothetical protein